MAAGDVTATLLGTADITSAAFLALMTGQNVGAQAAGSMTKEIVVVPHGNRQASVVLLTRSAA